MRSKLSLQIPHSEPKSTQGTNEKVISTVRKHIAIDYTGAGLVVAQVLLILDEHVREYVFGMDDACFLFPLSETHCCRLAVHTPVTCQMAGVCAHSKGTALRVYGARRVHLCQDALYTLLLDNRHLYQVRTNAPAG